MKPIHHALIALTCTTALSSLLVSPAKAAGACSVATRDKSNLSVYEGPDEKTLINELRFGRKVDIKEAAKDSQGRTWVRVAGDYDGKYRQWGWVIRRYLECGSPSNANSANIVEQMGNVRAEVRFKKGEYSLAHDIRIKIGSPRTAVNGAISSARDQAVESQAAPNR
jgi:hypothetical protein